MKNNLVFVPTENGGLAPALVIEDSVREKVAPFLAWDMQEFHDDHARCVIPEYDTVQKVPIIRRSVTIGYDTLWGAFLALCTGYHFFRRRPVVYRANSEGLRLIAQFGSPARAYASL